MKIENAKTRNLSDSLKNSEQKSNRVSLFFDKIREEIVYVDISKLIPFKNQPRRNFDDSEINSLAETIKEFGIRQPLTLLSVEDGIYEIVSGERRYKAAIIAGLTKIPARIISDRDQAESIALIENIQRSDLTILELGIAFSGLIKRKIFNTQLELSEKLGIPATKVSECIKVSELSDKIKSKIDELKITNRDFLRKLTSEVDATKQMELLKSYHDSSEVGNKNSRKGLGIGSTSIFRVLLKDDNFIVQNGRGVKFISDQKRNELKELLMKFAQSL